MPMRKWFYMPNTWDIDLYWTWRPWLPQIFYKKMFFFFFEYIQKSSSSIKSIKENDPTFIFLYEMTQPPAPIYVPFKSQNAFPSTLASSQSTLLFFIFLCVLLVSFQRFHSTLHVFYFTFQPWTTQFDRVSVGKRYLARSLYRTGPTFQWNNSFMRSTYINFFLILVRFLSHSNSSLTSIPLLISWSHFYSTTFFFLTKIALKSLVVQNFSSLFSFIFQFNFYLFILWFMYFSFLFFFNFRFHPCQR